MSIKDEIQDIESKEGTVGSQEKNLLASVFDGKDVEPEKILNNEQKFLNAVEKLESEINSIEEEFEDAEEEIYRREEQESHSLSDISETETEVEKDEEQLFEDIEKMYNGLKDAANKKGFGRDADPDLESQYGEGEIAYEGEFPSDKLLEEVKKFKKDVRRTHSILTKIENIEEVESEDNIPVIENLEEEIGRLVEEERRIGRLISIIEKVDQGDKTREINKIEQKAKQLEEQLETLKQHGESLEGRGSEVQDQTLQIVEKILSDIEKLKTSVAPPREIARFFADIQTPRDHFDPRAGDLRVRKADKINEELNNLASGIDKVKKEAENVKKEILKAKDFYDSGEQHAPDPSQYQSGESIGKAT